MQCRLNPAIGPMTPTSHVDDAILALAYQPCVLFGWCATAQAEFSPAELRCRLLRRRKVDPLQPTWLFWTGDLCRTRSWGHRPPELAKTERGVNRPATSLCFLILALGLECGCASLAAWEERAPSRSSQSPEPAAWEGTYSSLVCLQASESDGRPLDTPLGDRSWFRDALGTGEASAPPFDATPAQIDSCRTFEVWTRSFRDASHEQSDLERRRLNASGARQPGPDFVLARATVTLGNDRGRLHISMSMTDTEGRQHHLPASSLIPRRTPDIQYSGPAIEYDQAFVGSASSDIGELSCTLVRGLGHTRATCRLREPSSRDRPSQGTVTMNFVQLDIANR